MTIETMYDNAVDLIRQYGNTVLNRKIVKNFGLQDLEAMLSQDCGVNVWIRKCVYKEPHRYRDEFYIAETAKTNKYVREGNRYDFDRSNGRVE